MKKASKIIFYSSLALMVFMGFVLARFPASQALALASRFSQGMIMPYKASGTLWQGRAEGLYINVQNQTINLGDTQWQLKALPLLWGQADIYLTAKAPNQSIKGHVLISSSAIKADDLQIKIGLEQLLKFSPMPIPIKAEGQIDVNLTELALNQQGPQALSGNIVVKDIVVHFGQPIDFGSYGAKLSLQDSFVVADVTDLAATVLVKGQLKGSLSERQYSSHLSIKTTDKADARVGQMLPMLGKKQADDSFVIDEAGTF